MISAPSTSSKPPPQAMPFTAAMIGLFRLRGWFRAPNPPTPQLAAGASPAAAAFRSQPAEKNYSPAPVRIAMRRVASSRNSLKMSFSRRLTAASMAFALGRSRVISSTPASRTSLIGSDMSFAPEPDHCVHRDRALSHRPDDDRIDVHFNQRLDSRGGKAGDREYQLDQCRFIGRWPPPKALQERRKPEPPQGAPDCSCGKWRQQADGVLQHFGEYATGAEYQCQSELRVHDQADQHFQYALIDHLFHEQGSGQGAQALGRRLGFRPAAYVQHHAASLGLVGELCADGLDHDRQS